MSISAFDGEYAEYSAPRVLRARPMGNLAASMIGGAAILILAIASIFVRPNAPEEKVASAPTPLQTQAAAPPVEKFALQPASTIPAQKSGAFDLNSPEFAKEKKEFSTSRREGGGRADVLTIGQFSGGGAFLYLAIQQTGGEKLGNPDFFLDMSRQASQAGLAAMHVGQPGPIATRFGAFEAADIRLTQGGFEITSPTPITAAAERACVAVRMMNPKLSLEAAGIACGSATRPIDRRSIGCILDRLEYVPAADDKALAEFFAGAEATRAAACANAETPAVAAKPVKHPKAPALKGSTSKR